MTKKRAPRGPASSPSPEEIVQAWHDKIVDRLDPWFLEVRCFTTFEPKLRKRIRDLLKRGDVFTGKDMKNSLRVAADMAKIFKILQPAPNPKEVRFDTFQAVLKLCSTNHMVCRGPKGAGGWCNLNA